MRICSPLCSISNGFNDNLPSGLPNDKYFPYDTLEAKVALPDRWTPTPNDPVDPPPPTKTGQKKVQAVSSEVPSSHLVVPHASGTSDVLKKIDLITALQYGTAQGYPPLYEWCLEFVRTALHPNIPYKGGPDVILTCGNTDGCSKALQCLNNEWVEGDPIAEREGLLVEKYTYMNAIQAAVPRGMTITPVKIDDEGMVAAGPGGLEDVLENWDYSKGKRPHLIYTVTIGQNPTSGVLSLQRRQEIYALCQKFDIMIIEDDPYWYLQFPSASPNKPKEGFVPPAHHPLVPARKWKKSGYPFLDSLVPSYLSIDVDGRVVRLDTFSKTVAPGCRLGWITAQPHIVERILRITETSTQQPSGFVQSMIAELVVGPPSKDESDLPGTVPPANGGMKDGSGWNIAGWVRWLEGLRGNYERRMNAMCDVLDSGKFILKAGRRPSLEGLAQQTGNLFLDAHNFAAKSSPNGKADAMDEEEWSVIQKTKIYDFVRPLGGMFIWIRFDFTTHPLASKVEHEKLSRALWVFWTTKGYKILVSPGQMFAPTPEIRDDVS